MSLVNFHRMLIFFAILFSGFFAYRMFGEYQRTEGTKELMASIGSGLVGLGLCVYLPTVGRRRT